MLTDKLFTDHQQEDDVCFMQSRFYSPKAGRFLQSDTLSHGATQPYGMH